MARVIWTQESLNWLEQIYTYLADRSPDAADRTIDGIVAKCRMLSSFPELGYRFLIKDDAEVRIILYGHYRIAYVIRDPESVEILGVYHSALDIDRLID